MTNLHLSKNLFSPKLYPLLFDYTHRFEMYCGSAGSGKSYFITQKIIIRALSEPIKILVCRRYATTIRNTCFALFKDVLRKWKLTEIVKVRESDFNISFPNGSEIIFTGLDEETKLLSLTNISTIFIEEVYEVSKDIFEQLNLRLRGKNKNQQIICAWNPISKEHWLYDFCEVNPPQSFTLSHTTYKDNPFLADDYIASLEELLIRNPKKAKVYVLGEWGVNVDGLVFDNWFVENLDAYELAKKYQHRVGMDFGYNDPSAIIESFYDAENSTIYVTNEFYKTGQHYDDLLMAIGNMNLKKAKIVADSAEPRTIDFFKRNNINCVPCIKGQNSVNARIMFLQNNKIIVDPRCKNVIRELENFSYVLDKKTNKYTDDTTHEFSHSIDALGYAYSDIYTKGKLKSIDKSILGL